MTQTLSRGLPIKDGNLVVANGQEAISLLVQFHLQFQRGEWFLNQNEGVPYYERVLGQPLPPALVANEIAAQVREVEGVLTIENIAATLMADRISVRVSMDIITEFGRENVGVTIG